MRLVLAFSGFLAATAAASDAARGTLLSTLTGRVDDAAAADRGDDEFADVAAPAKVEGDVKNVGGRPRKFVLPDIHGNHGATRPRGRRLHV